MTTFAITAWVAFAIVGIAVRLKQFAEIDRRRRFRHDSGHQRLERGRFSKGANQSNHSGVDNDV